MPSLTGIAVFENENLSDVTLCVQTFHCHLTSLVGMPVKEGSFIWSSRVHFKYIPEIILGQRREVNHKKLSNVGQFC